MKNFIFACVLGCALVAFYFFQKSTDSLALSSIQTENGYELFLNQDWGSIHRKSLDTHVLPKELTIAGLVMYAREQGWISQDSTDWKSVFQNFGFFVPRQFAGHPELQTDTPVGLVSKRMGVFGLVRFNGMLVNCAGCHVGMGYNSKGEPDFTGWVGMPNTSIDLEAYSRATYIGLHMALEDKETTKNIIKEIFPDFSDWTIHRLVLFRQTQRRLSKLDKKIGRALPFWAGGPGLTNGVASLKLVTGIIDTKKFFPEYGFTSIPSLSDRVLKSSFLYDGVYFPSNQTQFETRTEWTQENLDQLSKVASVFLAPTMGADSKIIKKAIPAITYTLSSILPTLPQPKFPGDIDMIRAARGKQIYTQKCAHCHGQYDGSLSELKLISYPNRLIPLEEIGTDPERVKAISPSVEKYFARSNLKELVDVEATGGYVAPPLTNIWISAPYLHNGSVPNLYQLLGLERRAQKFLVGGHSLDLKKVGIRHVEQNGDTDVLTYPSDVQPWSMPAIYDTSHAGQNNMGHESIFNDLTTSSKLDIIEFLKLL